MHIFYLILLIVLSYFVLVFVGLRLIVPFMGFRKPKLPSTIPTVVEETIQFLKQQSRDQMSYLKAAYEWRQNRWHITVGKTIFHFSLAWRTNLEEIWGTTGFAHCTTQDYVLYVILVKGEYFNEEDVRFRYTMMNLFIHQYLEVKVGNNWIEVDTTSRGNPALPLGQRRNLFGW